MRQSALGRAYKNWTLKTAPICHRQRSELTQQIRAMPSRDPKRMTLAISFPADGKSWRAQSKVFCRESTLKDSSRGGLDSYRKTSENRTFTRSTGERFHRFRVWYFWNFRQMTRIGSVCTNARQRLRTRLAPVDADDRHTIHHAQALRFNPGI